MAASNEPTVTELIERVTSARVLVQTVVDRLEDLTGPSRLPGWTRGHVLTHLARNADGHRNLLHWAATGEPTPMYPSMEQRNADIETGAQRPCREIVADFSASAAQLNSAIASLAPEAWTAPIEIRGVAFPAARVLDHRLSELLLHRHDLGVPEADLRRLDPTVTWGLLDSLTRTAMMTSAPALVLVPADGDKLEHGDSEGAQTIGGSSADLALWLSGRSEGDGLRSDEPITARPNW